MSRLCGEIDGKIKAFLNRPPEGDCPCIWLAFADAQISKCTYTGNAADDRLEIGFDTAGASGNSFALAALGTSNVTVSGATLTPRPTELPLCSEATPASKCRTASPACRFAQGWSR